MSFPSSNSDQGRPGERDALAVDAKENSRPLRDRDAVAMKNFTFDASAAEATKLKELAQTKRASRLVRSELSTREETSQRFVDSEVPISAEPVEQRQESPLQIVIKPDEKVGRGMPSWLLSLGLHVLLILPLGFFGLPSTQEQPEELDWSPSPIAYEELESIKDIEIAPLEDLESQATGISPELAEPDKAAWGDLLDEPELANVPGNIASGSEGLGDLGMVLGEGGSGLSSLGEGPGNAATASFFGTQVEGRRILYLLDNSGGMKKGKFETLAEELLKSVDSLQASQQFYVIFYSDTVYPLFYPRSATDFVRATKQNKDFLRAWLETVELCLGNSIDEALAAANVVQPDVVFLLTDGKLFTTDAKERILLEGASRNFPINTFGMGVKQSSTAAAELRLVAAANRGTYRAVLVSPEAKATAQENPRPYHNKIPGTVWGKSLGR